MSLLCPLPRPSFSLVQAPRVRAELRSRLLDVRSACRWPASRAPLGPGRVGGVHGGDGRGLGASTRRGEQVGQEESALTAEVTLVDMSLGLPSAGLWQRS